MVELRRELGLKEVVATIVTGVSGGGLFISAILNRGKTLKKSIKKGAIIGILGWLLFLIYNYIDASFSSSYISWNFFGS